MSTPPWPAASLAGSLAGMEWALPADLARRGASNRAILCSPARGDRPDGVFLTPRTTSDLYPKAPDRACRRSPNRSPPGRGRAHCIPRRASCAPRNASKATHASSGSERTVLAFGPGSTEQCPGLAEAVAPAPTWPRFNAREIEPLVAITEVSCLPSVDHFQPRGSKRRPGVGHRGHWLSASPSSRSSEPRCLRMPSNARDPALQVPVNCGTVGVQRPDFE
jgi:hypothetical protein